MSNPSAYPLDAELIASAIADWARIESPSYDPVAVAQMMDTASSTMEKLGATVERTPGSDGYGDVVTARFNWGSRPGILVLVHLVTFHLVGTI